MNINYQSDFKIVVRRADGKSSAAVPFDFAFYVKKEKSHVASYDGSVYSGCEPTDDGGIVVPFNRALLGIGELCVRMEYHLSDGVFADGKCDIVSIERTGICLGRGATDAVVVELVVCPPFDVPDVPKASVVDGVLYVSASVDGGVLRLGYGSVTNNVLKL